MPDNEMLNQTIESNEQETVDKHEKFQTQSEILVRKAIAAIENVGKVSNAKNFDYSEEEIDKMFEALQEAIDDTKHMFKKKKIFGW